MYRVEVRVQGESGWSRNGMTYPTSGDAMRAAQDLQGRWSAVKEWRVVRVEDA